MADQFCRIVDTTINNASLGSDTTQAILTTDANTSYVIRDVHKTDSDTSDSFCMKFDIEVDGQKVHTDLNTSASGSLIVPPSTTVCIKETTGNFPLVHQDFKTTILSWCCPNNPNWNACSNGSSCSGTFRSGVACTVSKVNEGSTSLSCSIDSCIIDCSCARLSPTNNCYGTFGFSRVSSNGEYNVSKTHWLECPYKGIKVQSTSDGCCVTCIHAANACEDWLFEDDLLVYICGNNCFRAWDLTVSGKTCICLSLPDVHFCAPSEFCATYCCARPGLSVGQKGCFACRILTTQCTEGNLGCQYVTAINLCTCYACKIHTFDNAPANMYPGNRTANTFWSEDAGAWVAVNASSGGMICDCRLDCVNVCVFGGSNLSFCTMTDFDVAFKYTGACIFGDKLFFRDSCYERICTDKYHELYYLDLGSYVATGTLPELNTVGSCFFCNIGCHCNRALASYCVEICTPSSEIISGRSYTTDPSSKLTIYGIKST